MKPDGAGSTAQIETNSGASVQLQEYWVIAEFRNDWKNRSQAALRAFMVRSPRFEPGSSAWQCSINWLEFKEYVRKKYGAQYTSMQFSYAHKYSDCLNNPSMLESLSPSVKHNALKALVCLSKYLGIYLDFKNKLKQHGVKWTSTDSFDSFLRMFKNSHSDLAEWYRQAKEKMEDNEKLCLRFILLSGTRKSEGVEAFNLIVSLHSENKLHEYYNEDLEILEHFRFRQFLRNSKNVYISIIPKDFIMQITNSSKVSYNVMRKRLKKHNVKLRIKELRQYYASFMIKHGLIREEVDLLQGRIPKSIFVRHYWSPDFNDLRNRVMTALPEVEQALN